MTMTSAPSEATVCAAAAPIPVAPPTTSARFPSYRNACTSLIAFLVSHRIGTHVIAQDSERLCPPAMPSHHCKLQSSTYKSDPGRTRGAADSRPATLLALRDRTGELELDDLVFVVAQLAQDVVGVLGELRGPGQNRGPLVELNRTGHQLALISLEIGDRQDVAVVRHLGIGGDLEGARNGCPLSFHRLWVHDPVRKWLGGDGVG